MHEFRVSRDVRLYSEDRCSGFVPLSSRVILRLPCHDPLPGHSLVTSVTVGVTDNLLPDNLCTGSLHAVVSTDCGSEERFDLDIGKDVLPKRSVALNLSKPAPVGSVVTVDLLATYSGTGSLYLLHGPRGWAATVHATSENLYELKSLPVVGAVIPVHGVSEEVLKAALESVTSQSYPHWRISAYVGRDSGLSRFMESFEALHGKSVGVSWGPTNNGISDSLNSAVKAAPADADVFAFMDCDDLLHPDALMNVAKAFSDNERVGLVYTDEDKLDDKGAFVEPHHKPDFSAEMLLSQNYPCHLTAAARWVVDKLAADGMECFRPDYDGAQDHDFWLRCTSFVKPEQVAHIPRILYHWRKTRGSASKDVNAKPWAFDAGRRAVADHMVCEHGGHDGVYRGAYPGTYRVRKLMPEGYDRPCPDVYAIIPTKNNSRMLDSCLQSLATTAYGGRLDINVIDNESDTDEYLGVCESVGMMEGHEAHVHAYPKAFNWSAINNFGFKKVSGWALGEGLHESALLFMNDDVEALDPWWLDEMVRELFQDGVAVVGPKLLYPDMRIQHAGVVIGMGGVAGHSHKRQPDGAPGYFCRPHVTQQVSAVTGACMLVRSLVFHKLGVFDESLPKAFNDVDFCLRVRKAGYKIVYTPWARLLHHESFSRGADPGDDPVFQAAVRLMQERWKCSEYRDPFFNPNLDLRSEEFKAR